WSTTLGSNGGGNLATDPAFANAAAGNLSLTAGSPAIDVGLNTALPEGVLTDLAGRDRVYDGDGDLTATVDMGAYEYGAPAVAGLNVATVNGTQGQEVAVPVQIALDEGEVYGADLVFGYDASRLTATRVEQGALTGAWSLEANLSTPGQVAVSLAGAVPVTASGEFVRLVFRASGALGFAEVALSSADLNENGFTVTSVPGGVTVHSPVAVDFSGDDTAGPAPHTVTFTAQTSGEVETYAWSFGDGTTSGEESPTHVYVNAGTFDVSLTVTGPGGTDTETKLGYIVVHEPAQAAFNAAPVGGLAPLTVAFTNQSTGKVSTYLWDFGDGATSAEANPSHVYAEPGSYDVSLTASGDGGESTSTQEDLITVRLGTISGAVTFWNEDRAIPGVPVALSGSATITATSSMTGAYTLGGLYRGAYAVTPGDRGVYEEAVSPYDASLALKHAAGLITLADEALAAADVTLNNAATAYDASYILRASIESLPYASVLTGADWRYTPASRTYPEYSDDLTAQDYVGLLMGDISGNWGGGPEATGSAGRPVVRLRLTLAAAGAAGHVRATVALVSSDAPAYSLRLALRAPSGTTVAGCSAGEGAPGWMAACHAPAPGEIRLALAGSQAARPGPLAVLDLSLGTDMAIALEPVSAEIDEGAATVRWEAQGDGPHLWFPLMWR
ncbi:MAG: PKD domain-containing protein, partial [Chloroflexi bacterium]|nr:PKD domain-containing protein [Chloroflexota bacterium]